MKIFPGNIWLRKKTHNLNQLSNVLNVNVYLIDMSNRCIDIFTAVYTIFTIHS